MRTIYGKNRYWKIDEDEINIFVPARIIGMNIYADTAETLFAPNGVWELR